jgi:hypothetical protein
MKRKKPRRPLTRDFRDTVRSRAARDPKFREALRREGVDTLLLTDISTPNAASPK